MDPQAIPAVSFGSLIKKIIEVNPDLGTSDVIELIRNASQNNGKIDEARALELARSVRKEKS